MVQGFNEAQGGEEIESSLELLASRLIIPQNGSIV